jgi:hypothetical protein
MNMLYNTHKKVMCFIFQLVVVFTFRSAPKGRRECDSVTHQFETLELQAARCVARAKSKCLCVVALRIKL